MVPCFSGDGRVTFPDPGIFLYITKTKKRTCILNIFSNYKSRTLLIISGACLIGLFVGGPDRFAPRSMEHAWDLGHILAFFLWSYLLSRSWKKLSTVPFFKQCIWILLFSLCIGAFIEVVQIAVDRTPSVNDILKDLMGALVALAFALPDRNTIPKISLRKFQWGVLLLLLVTLIPLARSLIDETIAIRQFPVLSTFETPFEKNRWKSNNSKLSIDHKISKYGNASLKVSLSTARFSGVSLIYFHRNWADFRFLRLHIFSPSSTLTKIHIRINDKYHVTHTDQPYNDRFNETYKIHHGWNRVEIPIERMRDAPVQRTMDVSNINGLGIFVAQLPAPEVIYIDHPQLVK